MPPYDRGVPDTLRINEIFFSIQGESTRAGAPCVFVRLSGCHLRCVYCDTEYAFREGEARAIDAIADEVLSHPAELVCVTGGEPLLQARVHGLMERLCDAGRTVQLETSGACDLTPCDPRVIRIVDLKTPGSGEAERQHPELLEQLRPTDEVKFVILDRNDYEWARAYVERERLADRVVAVLFSAVFEQPQGLEILGASGLPMRDLAAWILEDGLPVRLQAQLHKFIWDPAARGV